MIGQRVRIWEWSGTVLKVEHDTDSFVWILLEIDGWHGTNESAGFHGQTRTTQWLRLTPSEFAEVSAQ